MARLFFDLTTLATWADVAVGDHSFKVQAQATNYEDSDLSKGAAFRKLGVYFDILTPTLENCTARDDNNPTTIQQGSTATLYFKANTGYVLPAAITVDGAVYVWDRENGAVILSNPTGNVSITITAIPATQTITAGTYIFKSPLSIRATSLTQTVTFISNDVTYTKMEWKPTGLLTGLFYDSTHVYSGSARIWNSSVYQTVKFTTDVTVSTAFYTWFTANTDAVPTTTTLPAGMYKWANELVFTDTALPQLFDFTSNNKTFKACGMRKYNNPEFDKPGVERIQFGYGQNTTDLAFYYDDTWLINPEYQVITVAIDQNVSADFYKWAITDGNLVKQVEPTTSETWVLDETLTTDNLLLTDVIFSSNGTNYSKITRSYIEPKGIDALDYIPDSEFVYNNGSWTDPAYRTITFATPPTGELLDWLQLNGTKQYDDCITFTGESSDFTLSIGTDGAKEWDGTVQYSTDHSTWTTWNGTAISSVDKKLYLRGKNNTKFYTLKGARLSLSARAACSGNIQTLLDYENPPTNISANNCYDTMFNDCTLLTSAPALPATTLADFCYASMFRGCTSLTTAPALPATILADFCYSSMFYGCTSLKVSTTSGTKIFTCPSTVPSYAVSQMFYNTGGTFKGTPTAGNTYYYIYSITNPTQYEVDGSTLKIINAEYEINGGTLIVK